MKFENMTSLNMKSDIGDVRDGYKRFFEAMKISTDDLIEFGRDEIISACPKEAQERWKSLKRRISENEVVYIRGFGRDAAKTSMFQTMYSHLLANNNVTKDPTNNQQPTNLIRDLTNLSKVKRKGCNLIQNYQVSHVFGRTKNVFAFTAPWNIVYLPKILDPFTGHEAKGKISVEFREVFQSEIRKKFGHMIMDFNLEMEQLQKRIRQVGFWEHVLEENKFSEKEVSIFRKSVELELSPIEMDGSS